MTNTNTNTNEKENDVELDLTGPVRAMKLVQNLTLFLNSMPDEVVVRLVPGSMDESDLDPTRIGDVFFWARQDAIRELLHADGSPHKFEVPMANRFETVMVMSPGVSLKQCRERHPTWVFGKVNKVDLWDEMDMWDLPIGLPASKSNDDDNDDDTNE